MRGSSCSSSSCCCCDRGKTKSTLSLRLSLTKLQGFLVMAPEDFTLIYAPQEKIWICVYRSSCWAMVIFCWTFMCFPIPDTVDHTQCKKTWLDWIVIDISGGIVWLSCDQRFVQPWSPPVVSACLKGQMLYVMWVRMSVRWGWCDCPQAWCPLNLQHSCLAELAFIPLYVRTKTCTSPSEKPGIVLCVTIFILLALVYRMVHD